MEILWGFALVLLVLAGVSWCAAAKPRVFRCCR